MHSDDKNEVATLRAKLAAAEAALDEAERRLGGKERMIERLERRIRDLVQARWGRSSEKHPGQAELSLFNEAELAAMDIGAVDDEPVDESAGTDSSGGDTVPAKPSTPRRKRALPDGLERIRVVHDLDDAERRAACGATLVPIGEEITEQLGILPQRHFVIQHVKIKYACPCKSCGVRTASMPVPVIPGSHASPGLLAWSMVGKYHDCIPLYRQERIARTFGVELPRGKLARWLIRASTHLQPLYNLMEEALFAHDIVWTDDTGIQVLKEDGRQASTTSALWIRRGGAPGTPVVLMDYRRTKGESDARPLLDRCTGYLVSDAAPVFENLCAAYALVAVLCNDHARRKFVKAGKIPKGRPMPQGWIATKAVGFYKVLYRIEREARELTPDQRRERRQRLAVPVWDEFMGWAKRMHVEGVKDSATREALAYLIGHETGLRRYCEDGRLPISNIRSEHVAKTVALSRKNFLFADTPAGATASALIWSVMESAKANGHNVLEYMTVVLAELPGVGTVEDIEALLPWALTGEQVSRRYAEQPAPGRKNVGVAP